MSRPLLLSLDADTRVEPNYLESVRAHFADPYAWAAVIAYAHPIEGTPEEQAAIASYEILLRYHVLGLRWAGSPYAFPSIGSTIVCRAEAYVAVSGMNRRRGGEDFYFLQQLAKTGGVGFINTTTVRPSGRPSSRVPFGTGAYVRQFLDGDCPRPTGSTTRRRSAFCGIGSSTLRHTRRTRARRSWKARAASVPNSANSSNRSSSLTHGRNYRQMCPIVAPSSTGFTSGLTDSAR